MLIKLFRHPRFSGYLIGVLDVYGNARPFGVQATGATGFTVIEEEPESKVWENDLTPARLSDLEDKAKEAMRVYFRVPSISIATAVRPNGEISAVGECQICGKAVAESYNPGMTSPARTVHMGPCTPPKGSVLFVRELWGLSHADTRELAEFASKVFGSNPHVYMVLFQYRMSGRVDRVDSCGEGLVRVGVEGYQF